MSAAAQIIERPIDGKTVIQLPMAPFTEKEFGAAAQRYVFRCAAPPTKIFSPLATNIAVRCTFSILFPPFAH
jgi:hypothetical protein